MTSPIRNRQPAGTTGLTSNHKGGTFTHKVTAEPAQQFIAGDLEDLGMTGVVTAGTREDSEFLLDVTSVLTTAGGRRIAMGIDEEGDPGATMKLPDGDEETFSSNTASRTQCARYIVRDQIGLEAAAGEFAYDGISVNRVTISDGENPDNVEIEMQVNDGTYYAHHDFYKDETTLAHYIQGRYTEMPSEEVASLMSKATGLPLGKDGQGFLHSKMRGVKARMARDVDLDRGLKSAVHACVS